MAYYRRRLAAARRRPTGHQTSGSVHNDWNAYLCRSCNLLIVRKFSKIKGVSIVVACLIAKITIEPLLSCEKLNLQKSQLCRVSHTRRRGEIPMRSAACQG